MPQREFQPGGFLRIKGTHIRVKIHEGIGPHAGIALLHANRFTSCRLG